MRIVLRIAIVIAAAVLAAWGIRRFAYEPSVCNRMVTDLTRRTALAHETGGDFARIDRARRNIRELNGFRERCPTDVRGYVLTGANEEILGRYDDAIRTYRQAFTVERRPELYMAIGAAQIQLGRTDEAVENYVMAGRFNSRIVYSIESEVVAQRVRKRLRVSP